MPIVRSRLPLASIELAGNRLLRSAITGAKFGALVLRQAFGAGELAQPLRHRFQPLGVGQDVGDERLLLGRRQAVRLALKRILQQLGRRP